MSANEAPTLQKTTNYINEPTKRGAPTNKNISVRNMKAQIANMSVNDNDGFKNEYNVRKFLLLFVMIVEIFLLVTEQNDVFKISVQS